MSTSSLRAYHGDASIKRKYLTRVRAHQKADELVQAYGYWEDGRGCAVGCTLHGSSHLAYESELGIPQELAYLEDQFFERLPPKLAQQWPARFLTAARPGADLTGVYDLWSAWNLIDPTDGVITLVTDAFPDVQRIVRETGEACLRGDRISAARAAEAARAAGAAWAAEAAEAAWAAWAAWATEAARAAGAAWAAEAAEAARAARAARAAEAAGAARGAEAARAAYDLRASDKLIELMQGAP